MVNSLLRNVERSYKDGVTVSPGIRSCLVQMSSITLFFVKMKG